MREGRWWWRGRGRERAVWELWKETRERMPKGEGGRSGLESEARASQRTQPTGFIGQMQASPHLARGGKERGCEANENASKGQYCNDIC